MSLQIRRGTDAERLSITPLTAELIYTIDTQLVYVGDGVTAGGILVGSGGGGNGNYGNANVVSLLNSGLGGNIIPAVDTLYSLGNSTRQWKDLFVSNATIYLNNVPLTGNATTLLYNSVPLISANGTANITTTGKVTAGNLVIGTIGGGVTFGDGTVQTTAAVPYANANVAAFLASGTDTSNIVTSANVQASYFVGNGSSLSSITGANVIGAVPFATTANSVAGANVSGTVASATVATSANSVSGANVSGTVASATVSASANSVAGANVTGAVGLATFAGTANSVAGANVTGVVAEATFAGTANSVAGANVTGQVANALVAGTVYTAAQPTITSVGTLTGLSLSGNINAGTNFITNLGDPLLAQDAATKSYVDARASGLSVKGSVSLATTAPLSPAYSYNNGVSGVGATITGTSIGQLFIDGVAATIGSRVLIKNEVGAYVDDNTPSAAFNGIYVVLDDGVANAFQLERSIDCDTDTEIPSAYTLVTGGTLINTGWVDNNVAGMTVGTTEINFVQFSSVSSYTGGSAIDVTGSVISAKYDGTTIITNASNQLTVGTVPGTSISGPVASATVAASADAVAGANVSGEVAFAATANSVAGINVTGTVASATVAASADSVAGANVSGQVANALVAGTVYTNAQPNITSVGTLTTLAVTGNVTANYFIGNGSQLTGLPSTYSNSDVANYLASNANVVINTTGNITSTANVQAAFFIGDGSALTNLPAGDYSNANVANYLPTYTGSLANVNMANTLGLLMGTPTQGSLVSNAVTLTTTTALTNGIALLNRVLGKLVPPSPPAFPAAQTLSVAGLATYRMANTAQVDNVLGGGQTVAAGTTVASVKRAAAYATNTITTAGPGDTGTVTALRNGVAAGVVTLTGSSNGTYGNLIITNNQDYNVSNASIAAGFWFVFSSSLSGTVPAGWNSAQITDTAAGSTNTPIWYYDASAPGTPAFSSVTMTPPGSPTVIYSSTVPHYTNVNQFAIGFSANRLSGDMYPTSDTFVTGTAGGAFGAPPSVTYQSSSLGTNILTSNASASVTTTATVISGFGLSSTGPSVSVNNSYATGVQALTTALGNTVLYKTGTASAMEETNITIGSPIGAGSGLAFRINDPGNGDTPVYTGSEAAFNSQTGPLETYDATIVAAILKHDQTNYSTGYLPVGPNLSAGRAAAQYFTFKFVRTATSKFDIKFSGTIAGMWVALPGSVIDTASTLNGWIDASINYAGSGVPGASILDGGNGSNGCGLGSTAPLNTLVTNVSTTCTFGTASSSSTVTNEIYVRIKLTAGQTVTALSLQTGSR